MDLRKTVCECGYPFTIRDIRPPLMRVPKGFYGGNVTRTCAATCPDCGLQYQLWIRPKGNTWRLVTIASDGWEPGEKRQGGKTAVSVGSTAAPADEFDRMDRDELKAWLKAHEVEFHPNWGEKRLRETARTWLADQEDNSGEDGDGE